MKEERVYRVMYGPAERADHETREQYTSLEAAKKGARELARIYGKEIDIVQVVWGDYGHRRVAYELQRQMRGWRVAKYPSTPYGWGI